MELFNAINLSHACDFVDFPHIARLRIFAVGRIMSNCMLLTHQAMRLFYAELHAIAYLISHDYSLEDSAHRPFLILCSNIRRRLLVAGTGMRRTLPGFLLVVIS